jgi:hypothetical protein
MPPPKEELWVPDPEDIRIWKEYLNRRPPKHEPSPMVRKKRKRRKKDLTFDRKKRVSPSQRGYRSIMVRRETYEMLNEMRYYYRKGFGVILQGLVEAAYDKTYKQAEILARIQRAKESGDAPKDTP